MPNPAHSPGRHEGQYRRRIQHPHPLRHKKQIGTRQVQFLLRRKTPYGYLIAGQRIKHFRGRNPVDNLLQTTD